MSPSRLTHCNGRAVAEVLRTRARVCVFYVEEDANGQLSRRPFWGNAHDYDPSRGLQVWFDGMGELEWVDEGDAREMLMGKMVVPLTPGVAQGNHNARGNRCLPGQRSRC